VRFLVNALSADTYSGRHVLFGHLRQLCQMAAGRHEFLILHRDGQDMSVVESLPGVALVRAPRLSSGWAVRALWEAAALSRLMRRERVDAYFSPTGTILPNAPVPQATLAQNPWCMIAGLRTHPSEQVKAAVQRRAYRRAYGTADLLVYNSHHMRQLYARNAPGYVEKAHCIAYQGIDDDAFETANRFRRAGRDRSGYTVLAVSVMASWKSIAVLIDALNRLHARLVMAKLCLVGPWPDDGYRQAIEAKVVEFGLQPFVTITGKVSRSELYQHYANARVFCLMSRCESFGIPAVEAQVFGTPVVGSTVTAMEEVCGAGAVCTTPDRPAEVADLLERLLVDETHWAVMSQRASANANRYRWSECSKPLSAVFELCSSTRGRAADPGGVAY
jgi:glycosyltransferase involved in cell wall biosynthesis